MQKFLSIVLLSTLLLCQDYSLYFDGVDDYVSINHNQEYCSESSSFTIGFYIKTESTGPNKMGFNTYGDSQIHNSIVYYVPENSFMVRGGGDLSENHLHSTELVNDGSWHHIAVSRNIDSNLIEMYFDGILVDSKTVGAGSCMNSNPIYLMRSGAFGQYVQGYMDELMIWDKCLNQEELNNYISFNPIGEENNLVGYWNFNEGSGNVLIDLSGNENHGTIYGADWFPNEVLGCTDEFAYNFNEEANIDDGSCLNYVASLNTSNYYLSDTPTDWFSAKSNCESLGGHLVTISSYEENYLVSQMYGETLTWIGLTDESNEGNWQWITGEPLVFTNWHPNQPDNESGSQHHAAINFVYQELWDDAYSGHQYAYVLEIEINEGDVTLDGSIDILDIILIVDYIIIDYELSNQQLELADLNESGNINITDIVLLVEYILNN